MKEQRKLAAIMFTDIMGYTALMHQLGAVPPIGQDEA